MISIGHKDVTSLHLPPSLSTTRIAILETDCPPASMALDMGLVNGLHQRQSKVVDDAALKQTMARLENYLQAAMKMALFKRDPHHSLKKSVYEGWSSAQTDFTKLVCEDYPTLPASSQAFIDKLLGKLGFRLRFAQAPCANQRFSLPPDF
ncbi:hypothetical protein H1R20_g7139, partial [Candolleomyces eurysporus]